MCLWNTVTLAGSFGVKVSKATRGDVNSEVNIKGLTQGICIPNTETAGLLCIDLKLQATLKIIDRQTNRKSLNKMIPIIWSRSIQRLRPLYTDYADNNANSVTISSPPCFLRKKYPEGDEISFVTSEYWHGYLKVQRMFQMPLNGISLHTTATQ